MNLNKLIIALVLMLSLNSCATLLGGKKTDYQRHKPPGGHRELRMGFLIADIVFTGGIGVLIDFATKKIYEPVPDGKEARQQ